MGEYGYAYKSVSSYTSVRNETRKPAIIQPPFVPSLPKTTDHGDGYNSEGHVTRKTIIPVTSTMPYHDYSSTPTSPVGGSPRKVHEFPSPTKPQRFSPMAPNSPDWRQTPQPTSPPYNSGTAEGRKPFGSANHDGYDAHGSNGYGGHGDYGGHKEGRKPIESAIRNDNYDAAHNGYGSDFGSKKGPHKPIASTINYDHHNDTNNGYGGDYGKGHKPIPSNIRNDNYDHHNGTNDGYGGGDYGKGHKPIASTIRNGNYDGYNNGTNNGYGYGYGYGDYNSNKEGHKPIGGTNHGSYYSNGYGGDKEGRKPIGSSTKIDNYQYDGPNGYRGYGGHDDDHFNNKEGYRPISNPNYNNGYGTINGAKYDNYNNRDGHGHMQKPVGLKISSAWTAAPRKGTQLSEPTNDIEKALELLRMEAAKRDMYNKTDSDYEYDQYDRPTPTAHLANWAGPPGPGSNGSRFAGGSSSPQHGSPRVANNKFGNSHSSPQPRMSPTTRDTIFDGRDGGDDYHRDDEYGHVLVIDSRDAEKKFKGTRVW